MSLVIGFSGTSAIVLPSFISISLLFLFVVGAMLLMINSVMWLIQLNCLLTWIFKALG